jgi:16S rRNA processing protein RimM
LDPVTAPGEGLLRVGRVARSHGLRGEVLVELTSDRRERSAVGAAFVTDDRDLVVAEARSHQKRWLMRFEGVTDRPGADELRGTVLWAEPIEDEGTLWVHDLIGCAVRDQSGVVRGNVLSVLDNPAADIMELDSGALVPVNFIVSGPEHSEVLVDVPDGLFDL